MLLFRVKYTDNINKVISYSVQSAANPEQAKRQLLEVYGTMITVMAVEEMKR